MSSSGNRPSWMSSRNVREDELSRLLKGASGPPTTIPFLYTVNSTVTRVD